MRGRPTTAAPVFGAVMFGVDCGSAALLHAGCYVAPVVRTALCNGKRAERAPRARHVHRAIRRAPRALKVRLRKCLGLEDSR